jgi:hypothetical protein
VPERTQVRVFTLAFDPVSERFDDTPVRDFLADKVIETVTDHFFIHARCHEAMDEDNRRGTGRRLAVAHPREHRQTLHLHPATGEGSLDLLRVLFLVAHPEASGSVASKCLTRKDRGTWQAPIKACDSRRRKAFLPCLGSGSACARGGEAAAVASVDAVRSSPHLHCGSSDSMRRR